MVKRNAISSLIVNAPAGIETVDKTPGATQFGADRRQNISMDKIKMAALLFKHKVYRVLKYEFCYEPPKLLNKILIDIIKEAKRNGFNEYDAAIRFLIIRMHFFEKDNQEVRHFCANQLNNIINFCDYGTVDRVFVLRDLRSLLNDSIAFQGQEINDIISKIDRYCENFGDPGKAHDSSH